LDSKGSDGSDSDEYETDLEEEFKEEKDLIKHKRRYICKRVDSLIFRQFQNF